MRRVFVLVSVCMLGLFPTHSVQAQAQVTQPISVVATQIIELGDSPPLPYFDESRMGHGPDPGVFYSNVMGSGPGGGYVYDNDWFNPVEVADDIPFFGTKHVTGLSFSYVTTHVGDDLAITVNFYGDVDDAGAPTGGPVRSLLVGGLRGSPGGSPTRWLASVNLEVTASDFDWTASSVGKYTFNWLGLSWDTPGTGIVLATGAEPASRDVLWTNRNRDEPHEMGSFFFNYDADPPANLWFVIRGIDVP